MTKLVELLSIEHGIRQALQVLGSVGVEDAIQRVTGSRRSASLVRKCADPDNHANQIQHRYSIALDVGCMERDSPPPMLAVHSQALHRLNIGAQSKHQRANSGLANAVLHLQSALGNLSREVLEAQLPDSPSGRALSNREKHQIFDTAEKLMTGTEALIRYLDGQ